MSKPPWEWIKLNVEHRRPTISTRQRMTRAAAATLMIVAAGSCSKPATTVDVIDSLGPDTPEVTIAQFGSDAFDDMPQYIAVRKSPTQGVDATARAGCEALLPGLHGLPFYGNKHTCVIFNTGIVTTITDAPTRRQLLRQGFEEVRVRIAHEASPHRRLAVVVMVWDLLNAPVEQVQTYVADLAAAAREARLPVLFDLDAVDWWNKRPDLWNFFDAAKPGYNPANVANVEWTGETQASATRVFWRNWGAQIRVEAPIPNFGAPQFLSATETVLRAVVPAIKAYVDALPPDQQYLYGGVIIGTELAIGVNHYHYPNGNSYLGNPTACDPGLTYTAASGCPAPVGGACSQYNHNVCPPAFANGTLSGGMAQVGYRATLDFGLRTAGQPITQAMLDGVIRKFLTFANGVLVDQLGLPSHKVYAHTGGVFNNGATGPNSYAAAKASTTIAGWSIYGRTASSTVGTFIDATPIQQALPWSSPEWLGVAANATPASVWTTALEEALTFRNNRMIAVANWEGVSDNASAVSGIGLTMSQPSAAACAVTPRVVLGVARVGSTVALRLSAPQTGSATYVVASTQPDVTSAQTLAQYDVANVSAGNATMVTFAATAATFYLQVVTDGCNRGGAGQRIFTPVIKVDAPTEAGSWPAVGPYMFVRKTDGYFTFAWELDGAEAGRLQIGEGDLAVPIVDEAISPGAAFYVRNGFAPGHAYVARMIDNAGKTSNAVAFTP